MMWISQHDDSRPARNAVPHTVPSPSHHEGVGNALRTAYLPRASDMPVDFTDLLALLR